MRDKRTAKRVPANLRTQWEGDPGLYEGVIKDISTGGCFVFTQKRVRDKDLVRASVQLPGRGEVYLWGEVVSLIEGVGFGLRFTDLAGEREANIRLIVEACERTEENNKRGGTHLIERTERF